jgi:hypothetical protein
VGALDDGRFAKFSHKGSLSLKGNLFLVVTNAQ